MKRREFCRTAFELSLLSLTSSLFPLRALAQTPGQKPSFFVLLYVQGGWDTSLAMAPWTQDRRPQESDYFIEYSKNDLISAGNTLFGPAMAPLKAYLDRLSVVNGVFMSANDGGHDSAALYAQSGNGQGNLGVLSSELEGSYIHSPFGILTNSSMYTANKNKMTWDMNSVVSERGVTDSGDLLDMQDQNSPLSNARHSMMSYSDRVAVFNAKVKPADGTNLGYDQVIAAALSSGLSGSVFYSLFGGNLDTHSSHPKNHLKELTTAMENINSVLKALDKTAGVGADGKPLQNESLLNQTTIMVVSEFTRTPALNGSQGKDHNPQGNSALLIGPGLKPGVVGEMKLIPRAQSQRGEPYLVGSALDTTTQQVVNRRENAFLIHPENVIATAIQSMGFAPGRISQDLGQATQLKALLKS